jgi:5-methylcytosine-specific restriction endonuclease McrA
MASRFYDTAQWKRARKQSLHDSNWQCTRCGTNLVGLGKRCIVHHRKELKRAFALAIEPANLQPLCSPCHNTTHAEMKKPRSACDEGGFPTDVNHPWYRK